MPYGRSNSAGDETDRAIVRMLVDGATRKEISAGVHLSLSGIDWRIGRMYRRMGLYGAGNAQRFRVALRDYVFPAPPAEKASLHVALL
jgi:DNA-binding NarL/FixJ family response regulator